MAHVVAPLRHPKTYPADGPLSASDLADHKLPAGAVPDGYVLMANDAAANDLDWSNDGKALINAPLRAVLIADSAAISNTATETAFNKTLTLLAGAANVQGARVRVGAFGKYSSFAISPVFLALFVQIGGVRAAYTFAEVGPSQVNHGWSLSAEWIVRSLGASASVQHAGGFAGAYPGIFSQTPMLSGMRPFGDASTVAPFTVNLTIDRTVAVGIKWGTADPANTITMTSMSLDVALPGVVVS